MKWRTTVVELSIAFMKSPTISMKLPTTLRELEFISFYLYFFFSEVCMMDGTDPPPGGGEPAFGQEPVQVFSYKLTSEIFIIKVFSIFLVSNFFKYFCCLTPNGRTKLQKK